MIFTLFVALFLEPLDELGEIVKRSEALFERLVGDGAGVEIADEGGAIELAYHGFEGDVDAHQLVVIVLDRIGQGNTDAQDVGFLLTLKLHKIERLGLEAVLVESYLEVGALGLLESHELPPVEVGRIVGQLDDIAKEVEVALGREGQGAARRRGLANFVAEAFAVGVERLLKVVEKEVLLLVVQIVEHRKTLVIVAEPLPEEVGIVRRFAHDM